MRYLKLMAALLISTHMLSQSDNCAGAPTLNVNSSCVTTAYNLDGSFGAELAAASFSCGTDYRDGFFKFVATSGTSQITITDGVGGPNPGLAVYGGSCASLTLLGCSETGNNVDEVVNIVTVPGQTYYIAIIRTNNAAGNDITGDICVSSAPNNQNCSFSTPICNTGSFSGNSNGAGVQELNGTNSGCLSSEHQSSWYVFQAQSNGSISLAIATSVDYDFAIWGPNIGCGALGAPIRCSYAAGASSTGLGNGASDNSEGAGGNGWVAPLAVTTGQQYIMLIDNFTANSTPFTLDFTSSTASLNCSLLPIELLSFTAEKNNGYNLIQWSTASELNNDYFTVEKSYNAIDWAELTIVDGAGTSTQKRDYEFKDYAFSDQIVYYRLKQTDFDLSYKYSAVVTVDGSITDVYMTDIGPNPSNKNISFGFYTPQKGDLNVQIIDYMGKVVNEKQQLMNEGKNALKLSTSSLSNGIYFVKVKFDKTGFMEMAKIIKN
jgi:hypothetical protein